MEGALRVSEMDGREFIRRSPEMAWKETFQPHTSAAETRRREKEARRQRKQGPLKSSPLPSTSTSRPQLVEHYIMNLPDSALEFLDAFTGLYDPMLSDPGFVKAVEEREMPMVHAYCFTREIEADRARVDICEVSPPLNMARTSLMVNFRSEQRDTWDIPSLPL